MHTITDGFTPHPHRLLWVALSATLAVGCALFLSPGMIVVIALAALLAVALFGKIEAANRSPSVPPQLRRGHTADGGVFPGSPVTPPQTEITSPVVLDGGNCRGR